MDSCRVREIQKHLIFASNCVTLRAARITYAASEDMRDSSSRPWLLGLFYFYRLMGAYEGILAKFRHKRVIKRKILRVYLRGFLVGAEDEARTRDPNLGKVVLYQLSYFRIKLMWEKMDSNHRR